MGDTSEKDDCVNSVANKDPSVLRSGKSMYVLARIAARWVGYLSLQGRRSFLQLPAKVVLSYYRSLSNRILPLPLLSQHHIFGEDNTPYIYPSVKEMCLAGQPTSEGGLHSCEKRMDTHASGTSSLFSVSVLVLECLGVSGSCRVRWSSA